MTEPRTFLLADVLSVTTGRLLTRRANGAPLDEILGWMTGDRLAWWQTPRAADACTEAMVTQHPFLADLIPPDGLDQADLYAWLIAVEAKHGETLELIPLADWVHQNPVIELLDRLELAQLTAEPVETPAARAAAALGRLSKSMENLSQSLRSFNAAHGEGS